ncbi:MAG: hypothetical protein CMJ65_09430 [Planctomycetaceae bacterium]|nr:hypothetical protein [Planctomycetaceae bacterium]
MTWLRNILCPLVLLCWSVVAPAAEGPSRRDLYFSGLRQRGLFSLAESACLEELTRDDLNDDDRLEFTLQLSRTLGEHAQITAADEQKNLWSRAREVLEDFRASHPRHPESIRIDVQAALVPLARGTYLARIVDLAPYDRHRRGEALETLQEGIERLVASQRQLDSNKQHNRHLVQILLATSRWRLAQAHLARARLMTPGTPDRAADLLAAEQALKQMTSTTLGEELKTSRSRLRARVARRQADFPKARKILEAAGFADDDRLLAERIWVDRDDGRTAEALAMLDKRFRIAGPPSDELQYLRQACLDTLWQQAHKNGRHQEADSLWSQLTEQVRQTTGIPDAYWATRSRQDAQLTASIRTLGPVLARIHHRAIGLYQAGRTDEALKSFASAIAEANRVDQVELAVELAFIRGSVLLKARRFKESAQAFHSLAGQRPTHKRSAAAHLLWAWSLGQIFQQQPTDNRRRGYRRALVAHRRLFATDPSAPEATWLLANLEQADRQSARARELWAEIPATHARAAAARSLIAAGYETELAAMDRNDPTTAGKLAQAISSLDRFVAELPKLPQRWNVPQADIAIRLARLRLQEQPADFRRVDALLQEVLKRGPLVEQPRQATTKKDHPDPAAVAVRNSARQLRILSLAGQGRLKAAGSLVAEFARQPADLLALLDGLDRILVNTRPAGRRRLGELQLQAALKLDSQRATLDQPTRRQLDRCLAQAYVATGRSFQAVQLYERLVKANPRDQALRVQLADLRLGIGTKQQLAAALSDWQFAERLVPAGEDDWMRIRLGRLKTLHRSGQIVECRKLLRVTRLLYPKAGTPTTRTGLRELEQELSEAP